LTKFEETKNIRMSEFARLRLDLWYWIKIENDENSSVIWILCMVEFAIPFGRELDQLNGSTLKEVNRNKIDKYSNMDKNFEQRIRSSLETENQFWSRFYDHYHFITRCCTKHYTFKFKYNYWQFEQNDHKFMGQEVIIDSS
jgi:hypothetical protein